MATKKREVSPATRTAEDPTRAGQSATYDEAIGKYGEAIDALRRADLARARDRFAEVEALSGEEPELAERARTYLRICKNRLAGASPEPVGAQERYHRAVVLSNDGRFDDALRLLDGLVREEPLSVPFLYARASVLALKGVVDRAVADLRQAIMVDPKVRFQAANDTDFERVREEPAFIDIIEPTPRSS
jgi:tetratricopeptide (TPR) repeat protein